MSAARLLRALAALGLAAFCGCASVRVCRTGKTMVDVENSNWLLFNCIPLASGNPAAPNVNDCRFFANTVKLANNIGMMDWAIRREGALGVRDLSTYTTDEYVLFVLLKRHAMHTSAELVMPGEDVREGDFQKIESTRLAEEAAAAKRDSANGAAPRGAGARKVFNGLKLMEF